MRRIIACLSLAALVLITVGSVATQAQFTPSQLAEWQAVAETYYVEGVDETALLGNDRNAFSDLIPGMIGPDFELLDYDGNAWTLSQFQGQEFVVLISGSWY